MPDFFWTLLMLGAGILIGYMIAVLITHFSWKGALGKFWDKLQKVDGKLQEVERIASGQLEAPDNKTVQVSNKPVSHNVRKPTIFEWFKSFFRGQDSKKTTDEQPKKTSKEIVDNILKVYDRLETLRKELIRIEVSKKILEEKLEEYKLQAVEKRDRLQEARQEIIDAEKKKLEEKRLNALLQTGKKDENPSTSKHLEPLPSKDIGKPLDETKRINAAGTHPGYQQNKENPVFNTLSEKLAYSYNLGIENRAARNTFWENYSTVRIGNNKAVEQRLGEADAPEFRILDSGNFLAVKDSATNYYLIVPQFDMTLTASAYNEGGVGFVFDFDRADYNQETAYSTIKVLEPAVFKLDGENWLRIKKGMLNLQI